MIFIKRGTFALVLATLLYFLPGCKGNITDYDREKTRLDSLNTTLTNTKLALNINEAELQQRITAVDGWYTKLYDTATDVAEKMRIDFNGFKAVYKNYIDNFFIYDAALATYDKQYKTLEQKVKDQTLTREEFKNEYYALKADAEKNYMAARSIAGPVYDLELSWRRYEKLMQEK